MTRSLIRAAAALAVLALAGCGTASSSTPQAATSPSPPASPAAASPSAAHHHHHHRAQAAAHRSACDTTLWQHVYHPDRLKVVKLCMTVRGTVEEVRSEPDGDKHIRLATRASLVNSANDAYQHGDLLLEEICQGPATQADAVQACQGVPQMLIPSAGDRVVVQGSYVLDQDHGWMEIHPVTSIRITGQAAVPAAPATSAAAPPPAPSGCYPKTPSGNCYQPGEFCPEADAGMTGVAGDGERITCALESGRYHWHPV
jgi:hypothetical protein